MPRHFLQRCLLGLLLVSRLLLGDVAHAMPHEKGAAEAAAAVQQPPCPEHSDSTATGEVADVVNDAPSGEDCCAKGGCDCPCLHVSAAVTPTLIAPSATIDQTRVPAFAVGSIQDRLSALFRPPA